jgi:DNA primase/KaiC/GvpD/RAD55 family RecA-like ATPase
MSGPEFIGTLRTLCKEFNISVDEREPTDQELDEIEEYKIFSLCEKTLSSKKLFSAKNLSYAKEHNWEDNLLGQDIAINLGIGWLSQDELLSATEKAGYSKAILDKLDLSRPDIFNDHSIIFTLHDHKGRAVGFTSRNTEYTKDTGVPKYLHTRKPSHLNSATFSRGHNLYGLHYATKNIVNDEIWVFEGMGNIVTAALNGIPNTVAIGSNLLSKEQASLLNTFGPKKVILCLDGDNPGQEGIEKILDNRLLTQRVLVVSIPYSLDPDEYIRKFGIEEFNKLPHIDSFEWRLNRLLESSTSSDVIALQIIPYIASEPSYLLQEDMAKVLSKRTGYSLANILNEISRHRNIKEQKRIEERSSILDRVSKDIRMHPDDAITTLTQAHRDLVSLDASYGEERLSETGCLHAIDSQKVAEENRDATFAGFKLGGDLFLLEDMLRGDWSRDVFLAFGGKPNAGKTSLMTKIAYEIARHEQENNALVIYHTIDDSMEQALPRFVCIAEGGKTNITLNDVRHPEYWQRQGHEGISAYRKLGYDKVKALVTKGRLVIKDANHGNTLAFTESIITYYKQKYPDRRLVYILDNFHKLPDFNKLDERIRFKTMSQAFKSIATRYHICMMATMEYHKIPLGVRPSNYNLGESAQIEYDSNLIVHLYNEFGELGELSKMNFHDRIHGVEKKMPVVELIVAKNKITDYKGTLNMYFYPHSSDFIASKDALAPVEE